MGLTGQTAERGLALGPSWGSRAHSGRSPAASCRLSGDTCAGTRPRRGENQPHGAAAAGAAFRVRGPCPAEPDPAEPQRDGRGLLGEAASSQAPSGAEDAGPGAPPKVARMHGLPHCPHPAMSWACPCSGQGSWRGSSSVPGQRAQPARPRPRHSPPGLHPSATQAGLCARLCAGPGRQPAGWRARCCIRSSTPGAAAAPCPVPGSKHKPRQGEAAENLALASRFQRPHRWLGAAVRPAGTHREGARDTQWLDGWAGRKHGPSASGNSLLGIVSPVHDLLQSYIFELLRYMYFWAQPRCSGKSV